MKNENLLTDDDIEMIGYIPNEQKKCIYILNKLKLLNLICFQKFVLVLFQDDLHEPIVAKIFNGNIITMYVVKALLIYFV